VEVVSCREIGLRVACDSSGGSAVVVDLCGVLESRLEIVIYATF